ncbi:cell division protein FtsX [Rhodohalobacter sulfatireducens]|uniref:Cell division protein FtsX n=1 Tax=Rhodohalobacter sulfatireducens TaxID=2911366 RepID=A0ABS9KI11_9BACT|nr:permease-like cell division protein FtsX [Rhodohalobacter sulfatireducens]MCG2590488.1 ABC transporter permease [Rhodohalobacter sulfatireducens]MDR9365368.1 permease-like cell division protein FtsX [Balneolaceae bacterium]MDR9408858.1 permease-like cell division protein FtsX [Balneolaceae bacterium]
MSVGYVLKEGFAGLGRARLAALTSMFSLFIAVLLIGVLFRLGYNAYEVTQMLNQQVEVEVFLDDMNSTDTQLMEERLMENSGITGLTYISKDSAAQVFQQEFGTGGEAIAELDFLPASFRLSISEEYSVAQVDSLVQEINTYEGVNEVRFNMALLQMIESRTETLFIVGGAIGIFILLVAMILVFNTIRLTIYAKRDLIKAMKLVGATNAFIRRPFLVEGVLQGIIAGGVAAGVIYSLFHWAIPYFMPQIGVLSWPFGRWYYLISGVVVLAIFLGWWGSRWAARKFIKDMGVSS